MCNIVTINAQGLRQQHRRHSAFTVFKRNKYDIILLQETHWTDELENEVRNDWGHEVLFSNGTANARGAAILFNQRLDYTLNSVNKDGDGRIISALLEIDDFTINIVNVYAPRTDTERRTFYSDLDSYILTEYNNIVAGDTNIALTKYDRLPNACVARQTARTELYKCMSKHELIDVWRQKNPTKREYTWTRQDSTTNNTIRTRIDRILISKTLDHNVSKVEIIPYPLSDHEATTLTLDMEKLKRGKGYWHFNNRLLGNKQFTDEIETFWAAWSKERNSYDNPLVWWDKAKYQFKLIAIKHSTRMRLLEVQERSYLEEELKRTKLVADQSVKQDDVAKYLEIKIKLKQLELREVEALKIRTKAEFVEQGEKSTRYFYSLEKRRQAEKTIKMLTKDNNDTVTDQGNIMKEVHNFYKELYSSGNIDTHAQDTMFNIDAPTLSDEARDACEGLLKTEELSSALNQMALNKSPGLDGLTSNFYKHFWPMIGATLTTVYNHAFEHGELSLTQRRGVIALLFKKHDRSKLKNWRPITLLTTDYKILTKALANRLKKVLADIIHTDQTASIKGRTINDNASLIRDALLYANEVNESLAMITIDQLKAFDRVDHKFLFKALEKFGFGPQLIKWIQLLYTSVSSCVKVNGWKTAFINLERGLRQGCPLSMPLYIITAEILAIHIRTNPQIQGLHHPASTEQVKLSQFADDTTLLLVNDSSIVEAFKTLSKYEQASGAKVNIDKCKGLWAGTLRNRT